MSLTTFLSENADVREYFRTAFQKPQFAIRPTLAIPPLSKSPTVIGAAFDYLMRWKLRTINSDVETIERDHWVADGGVARITEKKLQKVAVEIVRKARSTSKMFLKTGELSEEVLTTAFPFLDWMLCSGRGGSTRC